MSKEFDILIFLDEEIEAENKNKNVPVVSLINGI